MVPCCLKWNIHQDKAEDYKAWARGAVQRTLTVGGVTAGPQPTQQAISIGREP
jgi:hypothetical protein